MKKLQFIFIVLIALVLSFCDKNNVSSNPVAISILDVSTTEQDSDYEIGVTLQLDAVADERITARISSQDNSAIASWDYIPFSNEPVVFQPGETSQSFQITINGDGTFEMNEFFEVVIVDVDGPASILDGTAQISILNDDDPPSGPPEVPVNMSVDFDGIITLAPNSEASAFVNFGQDPGISNADWVLEIEKGELAVWKLETIAAGDSILFQLGAVEFTTMDTTTNFVEFPELPFYPNPEYQCLVFAADETEALEWKYNLYFLVSRDGVQYGPYFIDPKIRIPPN